MPDRETVAKALEVCRDMDNPPGYRFTSCKDDCPYYENGCARQLKVDALVLLKEQGAVEPKPVHNSFRWFACGKCGCSITREDRFCPRCGKAVKWG